MNTRHNSPCSFRPAREDDLPIIANFATTAEELFYVHPTAHFPLTAEQLLPNFNSRKGNTVVENEGKVAGFANFISVSDGDTATIGNVIIDPERRGKGIGKALLEEMARRAQQEHGVRHTLPLLQHQHLWPAFLSQPGLRSLQGRAPQESKRRAGFSALSQQKCGLTLLKDSPPTSIRNYSPATGSSRRSRCWQ